MRGREGGTVFDIQPEMSSTKAVRVLLDLTNTIGFEPTKKVIKKGGYHSKEEFVRELSDRVEQAFTEHHAAVPLHATGGREANIHAQL